MALPTQTTVAGALDVFSIPVPLAWLGSDSVASVATGFEVSPRSLVQDPNAASLLRGEGSYSAPNCSAWIGGTSATNNFVPGAQYLLSFWVTTSAGRVGVFSIYMNVSPDVPAAAVSEVALPAGEFNISGNFAPTAPGLYHVEAAAVCAIPAASVGGDIEIVNESAGNVTFTGSAINYATNLPTLTPGSSCVLHWSGLKSGILILG